MFKTLIIPLHLLLLPCEIFNKGSFGWGLQLDGRYVGVLEFVSDAAARQAFSRIAKQLIRSETSGWIYLEPVIRCEVKFQCLIKDGKLRSPSFQQTRSCIVYH